MLMTTCHSLALIIYGRWKKSIDTWINWLHNWDLRVSKITSYKGVHEYMWYIYIWIFIFIYMNIYPSLEIDRSEKAMAPHSSTLAWKIPWMEEPGGLQSMMSLRVRHDWAISLSCAGEGNGNPLQCSCLENPRDGRAWWAAIYGVAQSWTRLKWLSSSRDR